jgi:hypothetical protein
MMRYASENQEEALERASEADVFDIYTVTPSHIPYEFLAELRKMDHIIA